MARITLIFCLALAFIAGHTGTSQAITFFYQAPTGQTATVDYSFLGGGTQLQLVVTETTPAAASSLTGGAAILTSIGFLLPGTAVLVPTGSTVTIAAGSSSVGFDPNGAPPPQDFGAGANVSGEWGSTNAAGEKPIGNGSSYDFVSALEAQVIQFAGANLDGTAGLNGPQGGLLDDSAARGGLGVIDNSVTILLNLDADPTTGGIQGLDAGQTAAFLASLEFSSIVEWGSDAAFSAPIPEPGTLLLLGSGLLGAGALGRRFRKRS